MNNIILYSLDAAFLAITKWFFFNAHKEIQGTEDVDERVNIRRQCRKRIVTFGLLFYPISLTLFAGWSLAEGRSINYSSIPLHILIGMAFVLFYSHKLNPGVTREDSKQLWKKGEYILLLRPFANDKYENESILTKVYEHFPESVVVNFIERHTPCIAVGQPSEVTGAAGATRVYLSLDHWKEEIQELINNAKSIVVYLADTDSCLWEIDQLPMLAQRVVIFSDDNGTYDRIREKSSCPLLPEVSLPAPFYITFDQGQACASSFNPTYDGYHDAIDELSSQYFV